MYSIKPIIAIAASSSLLTGCMYFGGSVEECQEVDAPVSRVIPVDRSAMTMAVLPVTDELTKTTDNGAAAVLQSKLQALVAGRGMGLVDEARFPDIESQLLLIDTGATIRRSNDRSLEVLKAIVTTANMTYAFEEANMTESGSQTTPSTCTFTASIEIEARLYTGSPLQRTLTIPFNGTHQRKNLSDDSNCIIEPEVYDEIYREAAIEVANSIGALKTDRELFEGLAYVRELRICYKKKYANYVWLSSEPDGVSKPGTKVNIYRQYWFKDKLKNEVKIRRTFVAKGKITKSENPDEIWAKIPDMNAARKVMLGDIAVLDD
jgi:hypothetical protein